MVKQAYYSEVMVGVAVAGETALARMTQHYGGGYPEYMPGCEVSFAAHNGLHGQEVGEAAKEMATYLSLSPEYVALSKAAGQAHDAILTDSHGHKLLRGEMEERTAAYFGGLLQEQGVPAAVVKAGQLAVLGTKTTFNDEGLLVAQEVSELAFPTKEAEAVAMSVACADVAGGYSRRGPINALEYFRELRNIQANEPVVFAPAELVEFYAFQQNFLSAYTFPHPAGEILFGGGRAILSDFYQATINALLAGDIENWAQLFARSEAYARHTQP